MRPSRPVSSRRLRTGRRPSSCISSIPYFLPGVPSAPAGFSIGTGVFSVGARPISSMCGFAASPSPGTTRLCFGIARGMTPMRSVTTPFSGPTRSVQALVRPHAVSGGCGVGHGRGGARTRTSDYTPPQWTRAGMDEEGMPPVEEYMHELTRRLSRRRYGDVPRSWTRTTRLWRISSSRPRSWTRTRRLSPPPSSWRGLHAATFRRRAP